MFPEPTQMPGSRASLLVIPGPEGKGRLWEGFAS